MIGADIDRFLTLKAMNDCGGSFAAAIAEAFYKADAMNTERLAAAFPELLQRYGPGSEFFKATKAKYEAEGKT